MAKLLDVAVNTVRRRMTALARRAREAHLAAVLDPRRKTSNVQFDEMETFLRSRAQPLNIALAVRRHDGAILAAKVGTIPPKGRLAAKGREMGWAVKATARQARAEAIKETGLFIRQGQPATFICDGSTGYPGEIRSILGHDVIVESHPRDGSKPHDPMFRLNHTCAKIRADLACMARDTWTTTKKVEGLQERLDIYVAWNNGYF